MYTRLISKPPKKLIQNGKPVFGLYKGIIETLDIRGLKNSFGGLPLPLFISNLRIKSMVQYFFNIGEYVGLIQFFDNKIFGFVEVTFWDKKTSKKFAYRSFMGPRRRFVPHELKMAACVSHKKSRYIRLIWDHHHKKLSILFNIEGDKIRPAANAALITNFKDTKTVELISVSPFATMKRCSASWLVTGEIHGALSLGKTDLVSAKPMKDTEGTGIFVMNRAYYNLRTKMKAVFCSGKIDKKEFEFRVITTNKDTASKNTFNENILTVNGNITPLPPVCITHPFGINKQWIIQDTEGMIDLSFSVVSLNFRNLNIVALKTTYYIIYGKFNGTLIDTKNEKIILHNYPGIIIKSMLRL